MAHSEAGQLAESGVQVLERAASLEAAYGLDLRLRSRARPDEIRVIGVRQAVRSRLGRTDDRALLERERRVARPRRGERLRNRVGAFCVRDRMSIALQNG